jgi:hypothetical protein
VDSGSPSVGDDDDTTIDTTTPIDSTDTVIDPPTGHTGTTDTTDTTPPDTGTGQGPAIQGVLVDPDGLPLDDTLVFACTVAFCLQTETENDGSFYVLMEPDLFVAVKTHHDLFVFPRLGAAIEPAHIEFNRLVDLGEMYVPALPTGVEFGDVGAGPVELDAGDGLTLTVDTAELTPDFGVVLYDLAARRIPDEYVPTYPDIGGETVVGVFALHPFATSSTAPIAVSVTSTLPAGTVVHFRSVDYLSGVLSPPAVGAADGASAKTDPGEGIDWLTHLVVSTPP